MYAAMDLVEQRGQRCHEYIRALEEEREKIQVFQRELPLCLQLVTQAIESVRQQICDEESVKNGPVMEEFIPLKPCLSEEEKSSAAAAIGLDTKPDWLRSVQLWNQEPNTSLKVEPPKKPIAVNVKRIGGAFQPFDREKRDAPPPAVSVAAASPTTSGGGSGVGGGGASGRDDNSSSRGDKDKENQSHCHRKTRRCWSPELHRRFLNSLQELGGSHLATPKQIRELMKVDGLTNDEVKSHLQKYRLHTRRPPSPAGQSSSINSSLPAPQFVLVGGILVPPAPDYAAATAAAIAAAAQPGNGACSPNEIYAPVAALPSNMRFQKHQQVKKQIQRSCSGENDSITDEDEATISASPSTSASSQTTTASPPF
ncbi:Myb family transcription factor EFM-like [Canna indica]|uniref:Myb family transcription factor EFM-like n=1 Tax=Canna indica TaxID=4628 RepID=A0AAQ3K3A5_9LILI|nr:Myb family transcription factor EFM-like [Canna indica]